ncbi:MAG: hypothetical protein FWG10_01390 [Eubacteriaceae bacterium]|nr:hypothetical protein [Eubacteriaceae bacterium]
MAEKYYLMSKDTGNGPCLMGELQRLGKGEYQFRYLVEGGMFPEWFMQIPGMGDISRVYSTKEALYYIINRLVPEEGSWEAGVLMGQNGIAEFDEWDLLESLVAMHGQYQAGKPPLCDSHQLFYFYPSIPDHAKRYGREAV